MLLDCRECLVLAGLTTTLHLLIRFLPCILVDHPGNLRYQWLLDHYQDTYERAKKYEKMKISQQILARVVQYGGRFLRQEGAGWIEVDPAVARDKIAHAFRTRRVAHASSSSGGAGGVVLDPKLVATTTLDGTKRKNSDVMPAQHHGDATNPLLLPWSTLPLSTETEMGDELFDSISEDDYPHPDKRLRRCEENHVSSASFL